VANSYNRISEESARKTFLSIEYKIDNSTTPQQVQQSATNLQTIDNNNDDEGLINFHDLYLRHP
jgi:hypothetical protein